jgi:hypothetical protein
MELKDPRRTLIGSGELEGSLRRLAYVISGDDRKPWFALAAIYLAKTKASQKLQKITDINSEVDLLWGDFRNTFMPDDTMP